MARNERENKTEQDLEGASSTRFPRHSTRVSCQWGSTVSKVSAMLRSTIDVPTAASRRRRAKPIIMRPTPSLAAVGGSATLWAVKSQSCVPLGPSTMLTHPQPDRPSSPRWPVASLKAKEPFDLGTRSSQVGPVVHDRCWLSAEVPPLNRLRRLYPQQPTFERRSRLSP